MENKVCLQKARTSMALPSWTSVYVVFWLSEHEGKRSKEREMAEPSLPCMGFQHQSWWLEKICVLSVVPCLRVLLQGEETQEVKGCKVCGTSVWEVGKTEWTGIFSFPGMVHRGPPLHTPQTCSHDSTRCLWWPVGVTSEQQHSREN